MKRAKSKCAACGTATRRRIRHRAFVLSLGRVRPGFVCGQCARLGWLLVFGGDTAEQPRKRGRRAAAPQPDSRQLAIEDALSSRRVSLEDAKRQLNPKRASARAGQP